MANPLQPGERGQPSGADPHHGVAKGEQFQATIQASGRETAASSGERTVATPFAFVLFVAIELAFVFGLLVCTKLEPSQALQLAGGATGISVAAFFGRNAIVIIGRDRHYRPPND
jgi:hypothetical protein